MILGAIVLLKSAFDRPGPIAVAVALAAFGWMTAMRLVRSQVIAVKNSDYVAAARAMGASGRRIMVRHILPNAVAPVLVYTTITIGVLIAAEATLTFLGVGLQRPAISWGLQIDTGQSLLRTAPHLVLFPSAVLTLTVHGVHHAGRRAARRPRPEAAFMTSSRIRRDGRRRTVRSHRGARGRRPLRASSGRDRDVVQAVNGLSYTVAAGETLAILGESGSGKSVSAQAIMGILDMPAGGDPRRRASGSRAATCSRLPAEEQRRVRGPGISMIFQDALSSLNPVYSVGFQIGEMFRAPPRHLPQGGARSWPSS